MARIKSNGATKVAEIEVKVSDSVTRVYVMCSDGRILRRVTGVSGLKLVDKLPRERADRVNLLAWLHVKYRATPDILPQS